MDYDEFADRFLNGVYWETEHNGATIIRAGTIIDKYHLSPKPNWINRMADDWEHRYFKEISKTLGGYEGWCFQISAEGYRKAESMFVDENEMYEFLNSNAEQNHHIPIPASDRVVTLHDNQKVELECSTSNLLDELVKTNAVDGDELLRERFLAQLSAARELVRAQSIRAYIFYQLVSEVIGKLISTYGKTTLGIAAKKLLELYVEYLVKG
jgi:hypothetical protein